MINEGFCKPCQAMLTTKFPSSYQNPGLHHQDGGSFRQALDSGCRICLQIWADLGRPHDLHRTEWGVTYGYENNVKIPRKLESFDCLPRGYMHVQLNLRSPGEAPVVEFSNSTGSDKSFGFLTAKYRECRLNHSKCSQTMAESYVPSRLLDVSALGWSKLNLVDRENAPLSPSAALYATLSHCWGGLQPLKLTSATNAMLRTGIPIEALPKTFQHAVHVARRLEIRWLWIDSL